MNVTKSAVSCGFGQISEEILNEKLLCSDSWIHGLIYCAVRSESYSELYPTSGWSFCVTKWDGWQGCEYPFDAFAVGGPSFINPFVLSCFFNISICDALYDLVPLVQFKKR